MKVLLEGPERAKLVPETEHEKENLEALRRLLIGCESDSKVLCPIGQYLRHQSDGASFLIQDP